MALQDDEKAAEHELHRVSILLREAKTALKLAEQAFQQAHLRYAELKARRIISEAVTPTAPARAAQEWQESGSDLVHPLRCWSLFARDIKSKR